MKPAETVAAQARFAAMSRDQLEAEAWRLLQNLTATQERCTELLLASRQVHPQNGWWERAEHQIDELLAVIREYRASEAAGPPKPPMPSIDARGVEALMRSSLKGGT